MTPRACKMATPMADKMAATDGGYCLVSGVPARLRSADLRAYFSQAVEADAFLCFHYRHRPERGAGGPASAPASCCCLVAVRPGWARRLVRMYSGKGWLGAGGEVLPGRCLVRRVRVSPEHDVGTSSYKTKKELQEKASKETFTQADLKQLPELNPPAFMPYGNVGTPLQVFLDLIRACRMPARAIKKLQLQFPKTGSSRRYGNVPFTYEDTEIVVTEGVYTATGEELTEGETLPRVERHDEDDNREVRDQEGSEKELKEDAHMDDDDDRCEEWERHEALHEDVTTQERAKERLYEEEIELKWEKGGSGLVFYTDAQYWQEQDGGGDFDEETADDWDVDMSIYYDKDGGDKDARDLVRMRFEQRLRDGLEDGSVQNQHIGNFEKYTKGIGRKVMERQGWAEGLGLGSSNSGIAEALDNEGQNPHCKRGLGYHGEKLQTFTKSRKPPKEDHILISTIYDDPHPVDAGQHLLRRQLPTSLKFRQEVATPSFHRAGSS